VFEGFETKTIDTGEVSIHVRIGGSGPPLLLLHGYPQTHAMWHAVAPKLAEHFTVVCTDLRGYGDSAKPEGGDEHRAYSKRAMADDQVRVMAELGFDRFCVAGHDRGGRVVHRMCLDHPGQIERAAVLDIAPTATMFDNADKAFGLGYYHWFFLAQPAPMPERMIGADAGFFLDWTLNAWSGIKDSFSAEAMAEYHRCFSDPATIHASCEDYRAAATVDMDDDAADDDARIACPLLVLWGGMGKVGAWYDVIPTWQEKALDVRGKSLECGHFMAEERPEETAAELLAFFSA